MRQSSADLFECSAACDYVILARLECGFRLADHWSSRPTTSHKRIVPPISPLASNAEPSSIGIVPRLRIGACPTRGAPTLSPETGSYTIISSPFQPPEAISGQGGGGGPACRGAGPDKSDPEPGRGSGKAAARADCGSVRERPCDRAEVRQRRAGGIRGAAVDGTVAGWCYPDGVVTV